MGLLTPSQLFRGTSLEFFGKEENCSRKLEVDLFIAVKYRHMSNCHQFRVSMSQIMFPGQKEPKNGAGAAGVCVPM